MEFIPNAKRNRICRLKEILSINKADYNKITSSSSAIKCMAAAQIGREADMQHARRTAIADGWLNDNQNKVAKQIQCECDGRCA